LDSIILIPALVGVILFLKGGINFMVSIICLGIITQIVGDNSVLFLSLQNLYYPGHLAEVLFLWTYAMFAFGLSNQIGLFSEKSNNGLCPACGKSCSGHI
jgi:Mg2+/citrate symporter